MNEVSPSPSPSFGPDHLAFLVQPTSALSEVAINPAIEVEFLRSDGTLDSSENGAVTIAIVNNPSSGVLSGTLVATAVSGVATFSNLSINLSGAGYTLSATSGSLASATSSPFNISAAAASQLVFTTQPANSTGGVSLGSIAVTVEDAAGNTVTALNSITLSISNNAGPGGTLSGTLTESTSSGVATFPGLTIDKIGTGYTLLASGASLTKVSASFNITLGPVAQIIFSGEPTTSNIQAGTTIQTSSSAALQVTLKDAGGNLETTSQTVTMSFGNNAGGGTLHGTTSQSTSSGTASFGDLWIDKAGFGYTLTASVGSASGTSSSFTIVPAPPTTFTLAVDTPGLVNGCSHLYGETYDPYGNLSGVLSTTNFALSTTSSHLTFYGASNCSGVISTVTLSTGSYVVEAWVSDSVYETTSLSVNQAVWSVTQTVSYSAQTQLVVTGPTSWTAGTCNAYTLYNEDALGAPVITSTDIVTNFYTQTYTGAAAGTDNTCATNSPTLTIASGQSSVTFYMTGQIAQTISLFSYYATGYASVNFGPLTIAATTPAALSITGPSVVTSGSCSSVFHVNVLDIYNNNTNTVGSRTVTMTTSGGTQFYSDSGCSSSLPSGNLTVAAGAHYGIFYTKSAASESAVLNAASAGLTSNTFNLGTEVTTSSLTAAVGNSNICVAINGGLKCAGRNTSGQLGNGQNTDSLDPVQVSGLTSGVLSVAITTSGTICARLSSGVKCWGSGSVIGNGTFTDSNTPQDVSVLGTGVSQLSAGMYHLCALQNGLVYCWGSGGSGDLGQGNTSDSDVPVLVTLPELAVSVGAGFEESCAVLNNGQVWCWGNGYGGSMNNGGVNTSVPIQVTGFGGAATQVTVGEYEVCALVSGSPVCTGYFPSEGTTLTGTYTQIALNSFSLMAVRSDGSLWCDGNPNACGNGVISSGSQESNLSSGVNAVYTGTDTNSLYGCASVTQNGQPVLECWGSALPNPSDISPQADGSFDTTLTAFDTFSWL